MRIVRVTFAATDTVSGSAITFDEGSNQLLNEIFVAKVNAAGKWVWAAKAGGTGQDFGEGIALAGDSAIVTGQFEGMATFTPAAGSGSEAAGLGLIVLSSGSILVTGGFEEMIAIGSTIVTSGDDSEDVFIARLSSTGVFSSP